MTTTLPNVALSDKQIELLRYLYRQTGPVPSDHLDGRVVRALRSRDLVEEHRGWVTVTDAGRSFYEGQVRRRRRPSLADLESGSSSARAEAILRAIEALELAVPRDAEVSLGNRMQAYADDVMEGLRGLARQLQRA